MENNESNKNKKETNWFKNSISIKLIVVGALTLVMLIPLFFVQDLIEERAFRQQSVVEETNQKWGNNVIISGPILKIPYKQHIEEKVYNEKQEAYINKESWVTKNAFFLPEELKITSQVESKKLERSIYESVVFTADMLLKGSFETPDFEEIGIEEQNVLWEKASFFIETTNLKGIKNNLEISVDDQSFALMPNYTNSIYNRISSAALADLDLKNATSNLSFNLPIKINGSESLEFIPIGKTTTLSMVSDWHSPSFFGEFLPEDDNKSISKDGFNANWKIFQINRKFEQKFFGTFPNLNKFSFGTKFINPVDEYQKSERSAKYGILIIGLTFLIFFLIQLLSKIYIHPFQYSMIGLALVMFYTLLVSISEHSSFLKAYLIAAVAVVTLITLYSKTILKKLKFIAFIFGSLVSLYGFIYVIIQLENYALLVGSIGLFVILASVMFISKKVDWKNQN